MRWDWKKFYCIFLSVDWLPCTSVLIIDRFWRLKCRFLFQFSSICNIELIWLLYLPKSVIFSAKAMSSNNFFVFMMKIVKHIAMLVVVDNINVEFVNSRKVLTSIIINAQFKMLSSQKQMKAVSIFPLNGCCWLGIMPKMASFFWEYWNNFIFQLFFWLCSILNFKMWKYLMFAPTWNYL